MKSTNRKGKENTMQIRTIEIKACQLDTDIMLNVAGGNISSLTIRFSIVLASLIRRSFISFEDLEVTEPEYTNTILCHN